MGATWSFTVEGSLMDNSDGSPAVIALFFVLRCLVPLAVMLGISYLLRKFKLIAEPPKPPPGWDKEEPNSSQNPGEGGLMHGKV
jgi:hypothetical protein